MNAKRTVWMVLIVCLLLPAALLGQELRLAPYAVSGQYLNAQIAADTAANGKLPNRVYVLQRGGLYLSNAIFTNLGGWALKIKANDSSTTKKPVIMLFPTGTGATPWNPPGWFIQMNGNVSLSNLQISGYYELVDTNRWNMQGGIVNLPATQSGYSLTVDSCIFSNTNGNHLRTDGVPTNIKVTNCIFANMGYLGRSNLGAGKAIDLRASSVDTLIFQNNTFVNWLDRIVRHYPNTTGGAVGAIKYFKFDHNTLVNGTSYHGLLSLGTLSKKGIITNNLLVDPFVLGNDTDATRQVEYLPSGEKDAAGNPRITWIFSYPDTLGSLVWMISNNYYSISDSSQAFYTQFASAGVTGEGSPLTWYINKHITDSVHAFQKVSVQLTKIPKVMVQLARWYRDANGGKKLKNTPGAWTYGLAGNPDPNDYDRKGYAYLRDSLDCTYSTGAAIYTAGQEGLPVGDLNWFPTKKAQWLTGVTSTSDVVPAAFTLGQNYPNPFNPTTKINFTVPVRGNVRLEVFNLLGQKVAQLVNEEMHAGSYTADFNAANLGSGVYFYRLSSSSMSIVKKMVLTK